jgi:hypothetical protein
MLAVILISGLASAAQAQLNTPGASLGVPPDPPGTAATGGARGTIIDRTSLDRAPARAPVTGSGNAISAPPAGPDTGAALRSATPRDSTVGSAPSSPSYGR